MSPSRRLDGKGVVVTGGGRGIGRTIALKCAAEGASVVVAGRSVDALHRVVEELNQFGTRATAIEVDITVEEAVTSAINAANHFLDGIDVLVANSGIAGPTKPLWEIEARQWEETLSVNVTGTFLCCRAALASMIEQRSGRIVVIGSVTGKQPLIHRSAYAASKMALVGLVRTAALDAGPYGVRINLISPGPVDGDRLRAVISAQATTRGIATDDVADQITATPLQRVATADDVADAVVFLASDHSAAITGADLNVACGAVMF